MKNIFKKFIVLFSLGFFLFGYNFVFAVEGIILDGSNFTDTTTTDVSIDNLIEDIEAPIISDFTISTTSTSLTITINAFTSIDEIGVTGYKLTESSTTPLSEDVDWTTSAPTSYTFSSIGPKVIYAWAKDGAGNISEPKSDLVEVDLIVDKNIILKNGCVVKDISGIKYYFPLEKSESEYLAICALEEAKTQGIIDSFEVIKYSGSGLFVDSINGIKENNTYWALYHNDVYQENHGVVDLSIVSGDSISLKLTSYSGTILRSIIKINITEIEHSYNNIILLDKCSVSILGDIIYTFPQAGSPSNFLGICALAQAKKNGVIDDFKLVDFSGMGLFADSINGVKDPTTSYWALYYNDVYEINRGLIILPLSIGDTMSLVYSDFNDKELGPRMDVRIVALISTQEVKKPEVVIPAVVNNSGGGGSYTPPTIEKTFSVENALSFLSQNQNSDGSFGSPMYTDWVAIAAKAGNNSNLKSSILNYLKSNPVNSSIITDYERRAMALMALGINPYTGTDVNYINKIIASYDGTQIGDISLSNDDIFGLVVLQNAGYTKNDEIIKNTISFIIKNQFSNGSWGSIDMTAAAIQSLYSFKSLGIVSESISNGELYLIMEQNNDGSFGNTSSTSWVIQALSLNSSYGVQVDKAIKYLATQQYTDGGLNLDDVINNRIWSTSYSVPAALKLSWSNILESFEKEEKNTYVSDLLELKIKELIIEEKTDELIIAVADMEKDEILTEFPIKEYKVINNKITQTNKLNIIENNINPYTSLQASAILSSENNEKGFLYIVDLIVSTLKAPFIWFWTILNILL